MVKINYTELRIDHIVVFKKDTVFVCCKENGCARIRLFLAFGNGHVYTRNGRTEKWEALEDHEAKNIHNLIYQGISEGVAVYQFNGSLHAITKQDPLLHR